MSNAVVRIRFPSMTGGRGRASIRTGGEIQYISPHPMQPLVPNIITGCLFDDSAAAVPQ